MPRRCVFASKASEWLDSFTTSPGSSLCLVDLSSVLRRYSYTAFFSMPLRYQAHGESVKMETKMKLETVDRITYGLKACAREHSEWYQETLKSSQSSLKGTLYRIPLKLLSTDIPFIALSHCQHLQSLL